MRCRTCDYRLWNLEARRCPECGTPFLPSQYEFLPNTVRFRCPHCDQSYYGTSEKGHLDPAEFDCVSCGRRINMDQTVLEPTAGVDENETQTERVPWLERSRLGFLRGWLKTIGMALVQPGRLMRGLPVQTSTWSAMGFAVLAHVPVMVLMLALPVWLLGTFLYGTQGASSWMALGLVVFGVVALVILPLVIGVWALASHALLRLTGRTAHPLSRTYQGLCYSAGANIASAVPCVGMYFGWIWWLISAVLMVRQGQRVHGGRAAFAVLTPPLVCIGGVVGLYVWFLTSMLSGTGPFGGMAMANSGPRVQTVLTAVLSYANSNSGQAPRHAIQLIEEGYLSPDDLFIRIGSRKAAGSVPVGGANLGAWETLSEPQRRAAVKAAIDALPANVVAHRLGDYVFTYHGVKTSACDPQLWLVILSPAADVGKAAATTPGPQSRQVTVGLADGSLMTLYDPMLQTTLAAQNNLRASLGLPPIPDPTTVTHAQPALAAEAAPADP